MFDDDNKTNTQTHTRTDRHTHTHTHSLTLRLKAHSFRINMWRRTDSYKRFHKVIICVHMHTHTHSIDRLYSNTRNTHAIPIYYLCMYAGVCVPRVCMCVCVYAYSQKN